MNGTPPTPQQPQRSALFKSPRLFKPANIPQRKIALLAIVTMILVSASFESFYTVQPGEIASVRRLGTLVTPGPINPGVHLKLPWVDIVERIRTNAQTPLQRPAR
jgi:regulator of protease activity HflC (stomatin/prohibitin superfamily)